MGNKNSGRKPNERIFRHALMEKLDELDPSTDRKKLYAITGKLVEAAIGGDLQAIRDVMDRTDGKPIAPKEVSGPDGGAIPHAVKVSFE